METTYMAFKDDDRETLISIISAPDHETAEVEMNRRAPCFAPFFIRRAALAEDGGYR